MAVDVTHRQLNSWGGVNIDHDMKFKFVPITSEGAFHFVEQVTMFDSVLAVARFSCRRARYISQIRKDQATYNPEPDRVCRQCRANRKKFRLKTAALYESRKFRDVPGYMRLLRAMFPDRFEFTRSEYA
jgi:hypothetical protein